MRTGPGSSTLHSPRTTSRQRKTLWIITGAFGTILLFLITLSIQDQRFAARTILAQAFTVPAIVTDVSQQLPENTGDGTRRPYQVAVRFTDRDGKAQDQITWQFLNRLEHSRLRPGDAVEIVYLPHRTYSPYLKAPLTRVAASGWLAALTGCGAIVALAATLWGFILKATSEPSHPGDSITLPSTD